MACGPFDFVCKGKEGLGDALSGATQDALENLVKNVEQAVGQMFAALGSLWVKIPTPDLTSGDGQTTNTSASTVENAANLSTVLGWVLWISFGIAVASILFLGARMTIAHQRGEGMMNLGRLGTVVGGVIVMSSGAAIVAAVLPGMGTSGGSDAVAYIQDSLWYYTAGLAVLSVIIGGARMAYTQRLQPAQELLRSLLTLVIVSAAGLSGLGLLSAMFDSFSSWILDGATTQNFGANITTLISIGASSGLGLIIELVVGCVAIFLSVVQILLMVIRGGMLVLLAGILPTAAAFTNTKVGQQWFQKCVGWLIAFLLYKPAAAVVYATAFRLTGANVFEDDGTGIIKIITGLALMTMALVALPALMRFIAPMVSAVGGGAGGGVALAAAAGSVGGDLATGAIRKAASGGGQGGSQGGSAGGGQGASNDASGQSRGGSSSSTSIPQPGGGATGANAGNAARAGAGAGATGAGAGAGAAGGGAAAGGAAAGGAAAAAGPVGIGIAAAGQAKKAGQAAAGAVRDATEDAADGGPTGRA
jgi:type IV secretion system protein TrbL